jgi:hypothetical protein
MKTYFSGLYDFYSKNNKGEACDCPCDDLVDVETPKVIIIALSYIAQALVVTIVGCNMGFRYVGVPHERGGRGEGRDGFRLLLIHTQNNYHRQDSLDVWKKLLIVNNALVTPSSRAKFEIPGMLSWGSENESSSIQVKKNKFSSAPDILIQLIFIIMPVSRMMYQFRRKSE